MGLLGGEERYAVDGRSSVDRGRVGWPHRGMSGCRARPLRKRATSPGGTGQRSIDAMLAAVRTTRVVGISTSAAVHTHVLSHPDFVAGGVTTEWLDTAWPPATVEDKAVDGDRPAVLTGASA